MSQMTRQFDWLLALSWAVLLAFCVACFYGFARLIEWAA